MLIPIKDKHNIHSDTYGDTLVWRVHTSLHKKWEEFYRLYRLCGGIFGVLKLFVETSAGLVITKKKQNMGQEPQIYANIITTTFYFIQKLNKILFWLVGYTCLCSIIISYVFVAWCCWYGIRFFKFHMYANG